MGHVLRRNFGPVFLLIFIIFSASIAAAQSFPIPVPLSKSTIDANGVDLAKGQIAISETDLSIGPQGAGGLAHTRFWSADTTGGGWRHAYLIALSLNATGVTISLGDHSATFTRSGSTPYTYTSDQADGSILTPVGSNYTYTARDGTVITFDNTIVANNASYYGRVLAVATSIVRPSGEKVMLTYYQDYADFPIQGDSIAKYVARLKSVSSSTGYQLQYYYASDDPNSVNDWYRITYVGAINGGSAYCDPTTNCVFGSAVSYNVTTSGGNTIESVIDPANRTKVYTVDGSRHLIGIRRPSNTTDTVTIGYGADGRVASVTNGTANWTYAWSFSGTTLTGTVSEPLGRQRVVAADSIKGSVLSDQDELDRTTTHTYDTNGRPSTISAPEGNFVTFTYDVRGNVTQRTSAPKAGSGLGVIRTSAVYPYSCDNLKTCNQPTSTSDGLGNATSYTYDPTHGGVLTMTSPASGAGISPQTRFGYTALYPYIMASGGGFTPAEDPIYKLTSTSACQTAASCMGTADEAVMTYAYGVPGSANSLVPTVISKGAGDGSLTATTSITYDAFGNVASIDGPLPGAVDTTYYAYNGDRQVTQVTGPDPDGGGPLQPRAVQYGYSADGQVTSVTVGTAAVGGGGFTALQQGITSYDYLGRKVQDVVAAGGTTFAVTQYSYDAASRLDCIAVRMNPGAFGGLPTACALSGDGGFGPDRITKYTYDAADQQTVVTTGYGVAGLQRNEITKTYSSNGKPLTIADANGNLTSYVYDGFDRLSQTQFPSPGAAGTSNTADYEQSFYDANGNIVAKRLRDGRSVGFSVDALNHTTFVAPPSGDVTDVASSFTYDNFGRTLTAGDQNGHAERLNYDALGRVVTELGTWSTKTMQYDLAGHRTQLAWADGFFVTYDYLTTGEMAAIHENGNAVLASYTYDDLGRRTNATFGNGTQSAYAYDGASNLTGLDWVLGNSGGNTLTFAYNPAGQITTRTSANDAYAWTQAYNVDRPYAVNGLNQYIQSGAVNPMYDALGNLTIAGPAAYTYNSKNLMSSASGNSLYYDPVGRLDQMAQSNLLLDYNGTNLVAERNANDGILRRYVFGPDTDEAVVWYEGAGTNDKRWLHADERGSIVAVSDGSGNAIAINAYDAYGIPQTSNQGRFQYTGQAWIPEIGLYYYKARMYSPTLGRFLQTDPIRYGDGPNLYNYVHNNPISGRDSSGLYDEPATGSLISGTTFDGPGSLAGASVGGGDSHYYHITFRDIANNEDLPSIDTIPIPDDLGGQGGFGISGAGLSSNGGQFTNIALQNPAAKLVFGPNFAAHVAAGHLSTSSGYGSKFFAKYSTPDAITTLALLGGTRVVPSGIAGAEYYVVDNFEPVGTTEDGSITNQYTVSAYNTGRVVDGMPLYIITNIYPGLPH